MTAFTDIELAYLAGQQLGRLATVDPAGDPHVVPTVFRLDTKNETVIIGARHLPGRGQRRQYRRHLSAHPTVAFVVDDLASLDPWTPRGLMIRGTAAIEGPEGDTWVRIVPTRVTSWGLS